MRAILILLILCVACSTKQVNMQMYDLFSQDTIDYYKDGQWYKMTIPLIDTTHDSMQYKITQIVTDDSCYTIYACRNDSIFQIFSPILDVNKNNKSAKISVGRYYYLSLYKIFPVDSIMGIPVMPNLGITSFIYGNKRISLKKECHNRIYQARNLDGLYLIK